MAERMSRALGSWLGMEPGDLVSEGWLALCEGRNPWWAMRRAALAWYGYARGQRESLMIQWGWDIECVEPERFEDEEDAREHLFILLLTRLSPLRRKIILGLYYHQHPPEVVARALRIPRASVSRHRYRAIEQMKGWAGNPSEALRAQREREREWRRRNPERVRAIRARHSRDC